MSEVEPLGNDRGAEMTTPKLIIPAQSGIQYYLQRMDQKYYVYILASKRNGTLYIGVTNNLARRVWQHRQGLVEGFTNQYNVCRPVYYETSAALLSAWRVVPAISPAHAGRSRDCGTAGSERRLRTPFHQPL